MTSIRYSTAAFLGTKRRSRKPENAGRARTVPLRPPSPSPRTKTIIESHTVVMTWNRPSNDDRNESYISPILPLDQVNDEVILELVNPLVKLDDQRLGDDLQRVDSFVEKHRSEKLLSTDDHTVIFMEEGFGKSTSNPTIPTTVNNSKLKFEYVRMPCSNRSESFASQNEIEKRWKNIQKALVNCKLSNFDDLKDTILSYNSQYASKWQFDGLREFIENSLDKNERDILLKTTLPKLAKLAMQLPNSIKQPIPLLRKGMSHTITMTQQQAACLLANALLCTYPPRNRLTIDTDKNTFTDINFSRLFALMETGSAKLNCIFHYFSRVLTKMPKGVISFERRCIDQFPDWSRSSTKFMKLQAYSKGTIEDDGDNMLQVVFSSKFVGGGVLMSRCVQEEIRFLICPEMIVSRIFTEELDDNECLIMTGCERYSQYTGYGRTFQWSKPYTDMCGFDDFNRRKTQVVAIDAKPYKFLGYPYGSQFSRKEIIRELNKAYCGFLPSGPQTAGQLQTVATGNWGCGGLGGDKELKSIIQYMAASECKRDIAYFTFGDAAFAEDLNSVAEMIRENELTIGNVLNMILNYNDKFVKPSATLSPKPTTTLFDYVLSANPHERKNSKCTIS